MTSAELERKILEYLILTLRSEPVTVSWGSFCTKIRCHDAGLIENVLEGMITEELIELRKESHGEPVPAASLRSEDKRAVLYRGDFNLRHTFKGRKRLETKPETESRSVETMTQLVFKNWEVTKLLGEGGQGKVHLVIRRPADDQMARRLQAAVQGIASTINVDGSIEKSADELHYLCKQIVINNSKQQHGALKTLHPPDMAKNPETARARLKSEIAAMSKVQHPNLLRILEVDADSLWYVSEYHPRGPLSKNLDLHKGDPIGALAVFRALVQAVALLHEAKIVHRDIKPENVFVDADGKYVLGDFGIAFYADSDRTRLSDTFENVGSRDWMPPWAMGTRVADVKPTFDVYCLGKLLWSLIAGEQFLRLWYFAKPEFNLEKKYQASEMKLINQLLSKCIAEEENAVLPDATHLLREVDKVLYQLKYGVGIVDGAIIGKCRACGIGTYDCVVDRDGVSTRNFGFTPTGSRRMKIFTCSTCGNVQIFSDNGTSSNIWKNPE